jgi:hypothetical protein
MTTPNAPDSPGRDAAPGELVVDLPAPRRPVTVAILSLWLVGWAFGIVFMVQQLLLPGPFGANRAFLLAWLLAWAAAGVAVMGYMAWLVAGRERVSLEGGSLVIRRCALGLGRTRRWPLERIHRLRAFGREIPPMIALSLDFSGHGASGVRFECDGQVVRFARALSEHDARAVVELLRARHDFGREPHGDEPGRPQSQPAA